MAADRLVKKKECMNFRLHAYSPIFWELVEPEAQLERLAKGFQFLEGPAWDFRKQSLIFSDIIGDCIYRWENGIGVKIERKPSQMANGNTFDKQGCLWTCEHAKSRVSRVDPNGSYEIMGEHYHNVQLNSPNDIVIKSNGSAYFSDPNFGRREKFGVPREQLLPYQGVYRLEPYNSNLTLLADDFANPNGLCFDLEENHLFVNDSPHNHIRIFTVREDGTLEGGQIWVELHGDGPGVADGMKVDRAGNLYCCGPGGVHIFDPGANYLGLIEMPEHTANFVWGDKDLQSLYLTASTSLYRLSMLQEGYLPYAANEG
jgi:gluconolactonase